MAATNINVIIPAGNSISDAVDLTTREPIALICPAAWDVAKLSFQCSLDGSNFYDVSHVLTDQVVTMPIVPGHWVPLDTRIFPPNAIWLKLRSGHPVEPIAQSDDRLFLVVVKA